MKIYNDHGSVVLHEFMWTVCLSGICAMLHRKSKKWPNVDGDMIHLVFVGLWSSKGGPSIRSRTAIKGLIIVSLYGSNQYLL